jgi:hypothetical protein
MTAINSQCGNYHATIEQNANTYTVSLYVNHSSRPALWTKDVKHLSTARRIATQRLQEQSAYAGASVRLVQHGRS